MTGLATALVVIFVPGIVTLLVVPRMGIAPSVVILCGVLIWLAVTWMAARNPGSVPIQPEIFGGTTIGYSESLGLRDKLWATFVLPPSAIFTTIALLIGRASYRRPQADGGAA